ncbi:hypothetical protein IW262DRAFT_1466262 [Armillaria fumosa]|nr:hypothetical protein IW262DRAFT_1466262 [Armillaria fumosa]
MGGLTPSVYGAMSQLYQDDYNSWYRQSSNSYDYASRQEPTQPINVQYPIDIDMQQDSYDQIVSDIRQNCLSPSTSLPPSVKPPQQMQSTKTTRMLMEDKDDNCNRQGHDSKGFQHRPGACTRCKQVKMKCDFAPGEPTCQRCKPKGYHCLIEAPKPKKDAIIETLLKQLHDPYLTTLHLIDEYLKRVSPSDVSNPNVISWLRRLKSREQIGMGCSMDVGKEDSGTLPYDRQYNLLAHTEMHEHGDMSLFSHVPVRVRPEYKAQKIFLEPGFKLDNSKGINSPEILALGLVTLEDAEQLFDIFYKYIYPFVAILDPILFTPKSTLAQCPVLFTVICAIASRYHQQKSSIYPIAMHFAKHLAANALVQDEMKSVELCQAYILMSLYAIPQRSWERDQSWLYMGLAISIATEREYLNQVCIWKFCHLLDQIIALRFGKPWMMKKDPIIHHPGGWYRQSQSNLDYDVYLCGYNDLMHIVAGFYQEVKSDGSGLINSERGNLRDVTMRYDLEIEIFREEWKRKLTAAGIYRGAMLIHNQLQL